MWYMIALMAMLLPTNADAQSTGVPFELQGYAKGAKDSSVIYLEPIIEKEDYYEFESYSCIILKESFSFKGKLRGPLGVKFRYEFKEEGLISSLLFIDSGRLDTKFSIDTLRNNIVQINGSKTNKEYLKSYIGIFSKYKFLYDLWAEEMNKKYEIFEGDKLDSALSEMRIQSKTIKNKYITDISDFAIENNNSIIPIFIILDYFDGYEEKFANALSHSSIKVRDSKIYQILTERLRTSKSLQIGEYFPQYDLMTIRNKEQQTLSKFYSNKFTLIDFWFAKCGACIRQFPAFRNIMNSYPNTMSFSLVSITIDTDNEIANAITIIEKEKANWVHLWDKDGKKAFSLNISSFPTNYLLDSSGKVIAKNMEPLELNRFLRTVPNLQ